MRLTSVKGYTYNVSTTNCCVFSSGKHLEEQYANKRRTNTTTAQIPRKDQLTANQMRLTAHGFLSERRRHFTSFFVEIYCELMSDLGLIKWFQMCQYQHHQNIHSCGTTTAEHPPPTNLSAVFFAHQPNALSFSPPPVCTLQGPFCRDVTQIKYRAERSTSSVLSHSEMQIAFLNNWTQEVKGDDCWRWMIWFELVKIGGISL